MHRVEPKVFLVAKTTINDNANYGMRAYLNSIDIHAEHWDPYRHVHFLDVLSEFMGRLCYRSFKPGDNKNVKKVREGNDKYLDNILSVKHGSVLEHSTMSFVFSNISRVVTHELVRHRVGTAISQESLRYVRLDDLGLWLPEWADHDKVIREMFEKVFEDMGELQEYMARIFHLDDPKSNMTFKKKMTSFMRRIAPIGLATTIGWTTNLRNLRFVLSQRTSIHAEEEIRLVFKEVGEIAKKEAPNTFQDMTLNAMDEWKFENEKV